MKIGYFVIQLTVFSSHQKFRMVEPLGALKELQEAEGIKVRAQRKLCSTFSRTGFWSHIELQWLNSIFGDSVEISEIELVMEVRFERTFKSYFEWLAMERVKQTESGNEVGSKTVKALGNFSFGTRRRSSSEQFTVSIFRQFHHQSLQATIPCYSRRRRLG